MTKLTTTTMQLTTMTTTTVLAPLIQVTTKTALHGFPCAPATKQAHRAKQNSRPAHGWYNACVARPVKPAELRTNQAARDALQVEWDRLRAVERPDGTYGVWDEGAVEEWSPARRRARLHGKKANVGLAFGIVVEKNHELSPDDS